MSQNIKMQKEITYEHAIIIILRGRRGLTRSDILDYFAEGDHVRAGIALDEMVIAGDVAFDRVLYKLQSAK